MSEVEVISNQSFNENEKELLNFFVNFIQAIIKKDKSTMESSLDSSFVLVHMSGNEESKNQFISDDIGGVLNYFHSKIINPKIKINTNSAEMIVDVNLDAISSNIGIPPKSLYNIKSKLYIKSIGIINIDTNK